jgi:4'-phosphopantetheinyl transferase
MLASDELQKADRFRFEIDRARHVIGRGLLRLLLAHLLDIKPIRVHFEYSAFGKPRLSGVAPEHGLQFNVSHSGDFVLLALTVGRAVGIDLEKMKTGLPVDGIAKHFFSKRERMELATLSADLRSAAFFTCWTRKEAYIKAKGESVPLSQFDVSLLPGCPAQLLATRPDTTESARWVLQDLDLHCDYKAAIAVEGSGLRIKSWPWPTNCLCPNLAINLHSVARL